MPQSWKGVVFGEDSDPRPVATASAAPDRADGRSEAARGMLDREPMATEHLRDPGRGLDFLERGLRVRMDPVGEIDDLVPAGFDGRSQPILLVRVRAGGRGGDAGRQLWLLLDRSALMIVEA
jgi:hypothetical protein